MYVPTARERVTLAGRSGVFIVVNVDQYVGRADMVGLIGRAYLEEDVPFSQIRPYKEESQPETK